MRIILCSRTEKLALLWSRWFKDEDNVDVVHGDILEQQADAIISPANSFGFMDGGIDLAYSNFFGWDLQARLQKKINEDHYGELPIGNAVVVPTTRPALPWLVSAPTMRVPMNVSDTPNTYLAFRAALIAIHEHNAWINSLDRSPKPGEIIRSVLCPGMCTGIGKMPEELCARQMFFAYQAFKKGGAFKFHSINQCFDAHQHMMFYTLLDLGSYDAPEAEPPVDLEGPR